MDWNKEASRLVRGILVTKGVKYKQLPNLLADIGVHETERSIANKIYRGTFSTTFFLQLMTALEIKNVDLSNTAVDSTKAKNL